MSKSYKTSVIIPSLDRPESLESCLRSIREGTLQPTEIIIKQEKGPLAKIRNEGGLQAKGDILIFIDDDVTVSKQWLENICQTFERYQCAGASGPAIISKELRTNRDLFRFKLFKKIYDGLFLEGQQELPGHFTDWGAWTTGACEETCSYSGEVQFLEACNMSFDKDFFRRVSGFDESYEGVGDWSEPDLCFKIRNRGGQFRFSPGIKLYHNVSKSGAYGLRLNDSRNRLSNYFRFADRHLRPGYKLESYKLFLRTYYALKTFQRYCVRKT